MGRPVSRIELTDEERRELERRVKAPSVSKRDSLRAAIVLRRAEGMGQVQVAGELGVSAATVNKWSQRFDREGLEGLEDKKGRGRRPSIPAHKVEQVLTQATCPKKPRKRWTVRTMAEEVGISPDSVRRIEKSQCQALERTQPGLPFGVGHIRTETHEYTRHGSITLFAAMNYVSLCPLCLRGTL